MLDKSKIEQESLKNSLDQLIIKYGASPSSNQDLIKMRDTWLSKIELEERLDLTHETTQTPSEIRREYAEMEMKRLEREAKFQSPGTVEEISEAKKRELSGIANRESNDFAKKIVASGKTVWMQKLYKIFKKHGYYNKIEDIALRLLTIQAPVGTVIEKDRDVLLEQINQFKHHDPDRYDLHILGNPIQQLDLSQYDRHTLNNLQEQMDAFFQQVKALEKIPSEPTHKKLGLWFKNTSIKNIVKAIDQYMHLGFFAIDKDKVSELSLEISNIKTEVKHLNQAIMIKNESIKEIKRKIAMGKLQDKLALFKKELEELTQEKERLKVLEAAIQALQGQEATEAIANEIVQKQTEKTEIENAIAQLKTEEVLNAFMREYTNDIKKIGSLEEERYAIELLNQQKQEIIDEVEDLKKNKNIKENRLDNLKNELQTIVVQNSEFKADMALMGTVVKVIESHHELLQSLDVQIKAHLFNQEMMVVKEELFYQYADQAYLEQEQALFNQHITLLEDEISHAIAADERSPIKHQVKKLIVYVEQLMMEIPTPAIKNAFNEAKNKLENLLSNIREQDQKDKALADEIQVFCEGLNITIPELKDYVKGQEAQQKADEEKLSALQEKLALLTAIEEKEVLLSSLPPEAEENQAARESIQSQIQTCEAKINPLQNTVDGKAPILAACGACENKEQITTLISRIQAEIKAIDEAKQQLEKSLQLPAMLKEKRQKDLDNLLNRQLDEAQVKYDLALSDYKKEEAALNLQLDAINHEDENASEINESILAKKKEILKQVNEAKATFEAETQTIKTAFMQEQKWKEDAKGSELRALMASRLSQLSEAIKNGQYTQRIESAKNNYLNQQSAWLAKYEEKSHNLSLALQNRRGADPVEQVLVKTLDEQIAELRLAKRKDGTQKAYLDKLNQQKDEKNKYQIQQAQDQRKLSKYQDKLFVAQQQEAFYYAYVTQYRDESLYGWHYVPLMHRLAMANWLNILAHGLTTYEALNGVFKREKEHDTLLANAKHLKQLNTYQKTFAQHQSELMVEDQAILALFEKGAAAYLQAKAKYFAMKTSINLQKAEQQLLKEKRKGDSTFQDNEVLDRLMINTEVSLANAQAKWQKNEVFKPVAMVTDQLREKLGLNALSRQMRILIGLSNTLKNEMQKPAEAIKIDFQKKLRDYCSKVHQCTGQDYDVIRHQVSGLEAIFLCFVSGEKLHHLPEMWIQSFEAFHANIQKEAGNASNVLNAFSESLKAAARKRFSHLTEEAEATWQSLNQQHQACVLACDFAVNKLSRIESVKSEILNTEYGHILNGFENELAQTSQQLSLDIELTPERFLQRKQDIFAVLITQIVLSSDGDCFSTDLEHQQPVKADDPSQKSNKPSARALYCQSELQYSNNLFFRQRIEEIASVGQKESALRANLASIQDDKAFMKEEILNKRNELTEMCFDKVEQIYETLEQKVRCNYLSLKH